ncbi:hypothetical protein DU504_11790 [Haloplanus salinus]|jgi:hypothetical protein|uniref:Uncharacterized protein n=1 Tax=Haloplanus salinus TaxID=1126245 RepID=A0A368NEA0_9EURY|nr:hypothetical protein [Haloplanus salinus]RCU47914.1 hypothetical protein DU504_11790 [Haloplanus salinus]
MANVPNTESAEPTTEYVSEIFGGKLSARDFFELVATDSEFARRVLDYSASDWAESFGVDGLPDCELPGTVAYLRDQGLSIEEIVTDASFVHGSVGLMDFPEVEIGLHVEEIQDAEEIEDFELFDDY